MKNISPSLFLENFGNQNRTPKSESNIQIELNRPKWYSQCGKNSNFLGWISAKEMSAIKFNQEVENSIRKRSKI